jgi:hypothetical protein
VYVTPTIIRVAVLTPYLDQTKLPYIFETSFPEKENKLAPVNLWGVSVDPSAPVGDARVSVVLVKFLRARRVWISSIRSKAVSDQISLQGAQRRECNQYDDLDTQVARGVQGG